MRQRLKMAGSELSPETALQDLRRIQHHRVSINGAQTLTGVSTVNKDQAGVLASLGVKKPTIDQQIPLL